MKLYICIWWLPKIKVSWIGNQVLHYLISRLNGYLELQLWSCCVTPSCHKKALFSRLISILHHHLLILKTSRRKQNWGTINQNSLINLLCNTCVCVDIPISFPLNTICAGLGWILFFRNINFWVENLWQIGHSKPGPWKWHGEMGSRRVEQGFSSFFAKFLAFLMIFLSGKAMQNFDLICQK